MDYVVGSVAALISGNVTPNRPKLIKRALTPIKHQPSPDVTPKSETVDDRSIFLSPSLQKKKAIVKKSPKRIFENPDLDATEEGNLTSPNADKVKKHLKQDLETEEMAVKTNKNKKCGSSPSPNKRKSNNEFTVEDVEMVKEINEHTPKKNRKQKKQQKADDFKQEDSNEPKVKNSKKQINIAEEPEEETLINKEDNSEISNDKKSENSSDVNKSKKKKKKNKKSKAKKSSNTENITENGSKNEVNNDNVVNPNAITNQDSESEHESDNEIDSDNEVDQNKNQAVEEAANESSDEEEMPQKKPVKHEENDNKAPTEDEVKRTLFVGNVPFNPKCKKEIKQIFSKYGQIETVRVRNIPIKDANTTPKLAVIKTELHPERSTVNVYVKFADADSVQKALCENNTLLHDNHLRVTPSSITGRDHDATCAVFLGNLPFAVEEEELRAKFANCGEIESIRIVRDKKTNIGKGFGFINFKSKDGVELALSMSEEDLSMKNRIIRVQRSGPGRGANQQSKFKKQGPRGHMSKGQEPRGNFQNRGNFSQRQGQFGGRQGNFGSRQNNYGSKQGNFAPRQNNSGPRQNYSGPRQNNSGPRQNNFASKQDNFQNQGHSNQTEEDAKKRNRLGANKRLENKRKIESGVEGPPKEKKMKKEFVGMTAEKKKKTTKFDKGLKKKKAISEILTKK